MARRLRLSQPRSPVDDLNMFPDNASLPSSLQQLIFGYILSMFSENTSLSKGLQQLISGCIFDVCLEECELTQ